MIGINTAIQTETGEFSGVGFAIPSNTIKKIVPLLIQDGHYKHPWLGISGISVDPDFPDYLVFQTLRFSYREIVSESPASTAGLHGSNQNKTIDGIKYRFGGDIIIQ